VTHGVPQSQEAWLKIKGVGTYTSAALTIFSLGQPVLPIDTNIRRVLGRVYLGRPFATPAADGRLKRLVEPSLASLRGFADVPQAIFDLANANCGKQPDCATCPLKNDCLAAPKFLSGNVRIPRRSIAKPVERIHEGKKYPDRIYRGRVLRLARVHVRGVSIGEIGSAVDPLFQEKRDRSWLLRMLGRLQKDGLISIKQGKVRLP
jgi:A/G-specific adenine glycosylase